jgi:mannitol/fructose-specific phosphotransferase system IIA component (Ntr-type)
MDLDAFVTGCNNLPELKARDQWEAISELLDNMVATGKIKAEHRPAIELAVKQRETSMSTAIGSGIGLPHARTDFVTEIVGAYGQSKQGINFDAPDQGPVHKVILFLAPKDHTEKLINALANIPKLLAKLDSEPPG